MEFLEEGCKLKCRSTISLLGDCYAHGYGVRKDDAKAMELWRQSNDVFARFSLAVNSGDLTDEAEPFQAVIKELELLAKSRDARAQCVLARWFEFATESDDEFAQAQTTAVRWYEAAAVQGHSQALLGLARLLAPSARSVNCLELAADLGCEKARQKTRTDSAVHLPPVSPIASILPLTSQRKFGSHSGSALP